MISALTDSDMALVTEDAALDCSLGSVQKGTISEKLFEVCALRRGWYVASNSGGGDDFDHIIKRPEKSNGVVIQTRLAQGRFIHGTWRYTISFCQQNGQPYSLTAFDVLAVHLADADEFIFFTRAEIGNRSGTTYTRRKDLTRATRCTSMTFRDHNNWRLLDEVAESRTPTQ